MSMFHWLHVLGGTHLRKYDFAPGPYPKEEIDRIVASIRKNHPNLVVGSSPAWEAPFEDMIRVKARVSRIAFMPAAMALPAVFIYKVTEDRFFVCTGNLRCGYTFRRGGAGFHGAGTQIGGDVAHSMRFPQESLEQIEAQVLAKTGGKSTWDSGWSPSQPES